MQTPQVKFQQRGLDSPCSPKASSSAWGSCYGWCLLRAGTGNLGWCVSLSLHDVSLLVLIPYFTCAITRTPMSALDLTLSCLASPWFYVAACLHSSRPSSSHRWCLWQHICFSAIFSLAFPPVLIFRRGDFCAQGLGTNKGKFRLAPAPASDTRHSSHHQWIAASFSAEPGNEFRTFLHRELVLSPTKEAGLVCQCNPLTFLCQSESCHQSFVHRFLESSCSECLVSVSVF